MTTETPESAPRRDRTALVVAGVGLALGTFFAARAMRASATTDLKGKVVVITGGSRGLGLVLAEGYAAQRCRLVLCARDADELGAAKETLQRQGAEVHTVVCDVADRAQVARLADETERVFGGADILVNNASIIQVGPLEAMTYDDFVSAMAVNFWGTVHATLAFLSQLRERKGRIVNIDSIGGRVAVPHLLPYTCGKFAAYGFSEGIGAEVAKDGVRVTTVVPGLMRTGSPMNAIYKGRPEKEYAWFSLGGATPLTAMAVERAAARIITASKRGERFVVLGWQAKALRLFHDLAPAGTVGLLGMVNRSFPKATGHTEGRRGRHMATASSPSPLTRLMEKTAKRTHQFAGAKPPSAAHADRSA